MSRSQIRLALLLLVAVHAAVGLLLTPFNLPVNQSTLEQRLTLLAIGALIAQPALLALWAALGPGPLLRRWGQALVILALLNLAIDFASVKNAGHANDAAEVAQPVLWLVAFLICQLPLAWLRRRYRWRVASPFTSDDLSGAGESQFSMGGLLKAIAGMGAFLAALRWLHPASGSTQWAFALFRFTAMGIMTSLMGMLVLVLGWLVLAPIPWRRWGWPIVLLGVCVIPGSASAVAVFGSPGEVTELVFVLMGLLLAASGSLFVVRLGGYRLVREAMELPAQARPAAMPRRRCAALIAVMTAVLLALAGLAPRRLALWRAQADARDWSDSGFSAAGSDGEIIYLRAFDGANMRIDQATIDRINHCRQLQQLELYGSTVTDDTLELLEVMPGLTRLSLVGARISDDGLRHLAKFRNLRNLDLRMTDITDDGLVVLERLHALQSVDLGHTRVTPEGLAWLAAARPGLRASAIINDVSLSEIATFLRPRLTRFSEGRASAPGDLRVRAGGPGTTDVGVSALRGITQLAELDLSDAKLTDAAIKDLATMTGLKRLVLSGTKISDAGIERLRQALPDCEITR